MEHASRTKRVLDKLSAGANKAANTHRWHEGMAIGALPQNVFHTAQQLDQMARIVLDYAVVVEGNNNTQQKTTLCRPTIVAAYAIAELHLMSEGMKSGRVNGSFISYTGDRYNASCAFLKERCNEAARLLSNEGGVPSFLPSGVPLNTTHLAAVSAVGSSLAGVALSLNVGSFAICVCRRALCNCKQLEGWDQV
eukprot:g4674.t1 g4674   contig16:19122-19703(-)